MSAAVASGTLPEPMWAIIFKPWEDVPVYHAEYRSDQMAYMPKTVCGRPVGLLLPHLPMKHVKKFGKPCKGCFA
jgi:hypothetical protein